MEQEQLERYIIALLESGAWPAVAVFVVLVVGRAIKTERLFVPPRFRPWALLTLALASGVIEKAAMGVGWGRAAVGALVSFGVAMMVHELGIESLRGGREIGAPKPSLAEIEVDRELAPKSTGSHKPGSLIVFLVLVLTGCPGAQAKTAIVIDDLGTTLSNIERREGEPEIDRIAAACVRPRVECQADIDAALAEIEKRWEPVWVGYEAARLAHKAWVAGGSVGDIPAALCELVASVRVVAPHALGSVLRIIPEELCAVPALEEAKE